MKLYYAPGACSLASRISLHEAGLPAEFERVDLASRITDRGEDYRAINPKGSVPLLVLDDGQSVTENVAILTLISGYGPPVEAGNPLGHIRLLEMLSFLSSELHVAFKPFWHRVTGADRVRAGEAVAGRLGLVGDHVRELYLFGPHFSVADAYLFVMLRWARAFEIPMPPHLLGYFERVAERSTVQRALAEEGLPGLRGDAREAILDAVLEAAP